MHENSFNKICVNIDWPLLHKQKLELLEDSIKTGKHDGIVCLIDGLQDEAERIGIWKYPEDEEDVNWLDDRDSGYYEIGDADRSP